MQKVLADASIVVAWVRPAEQSDEVEAFNLLLAAHGRGAVAVRMPAFSLLEIANPLIRKHHWSAAKVQRFYSLVEQLGLVDLGANDNLAIQHTPELAEKHQLTTYDAYYAAIAASNSEKLVSLDSDLLAAGVAQLPSETIGFLGLRT